MAYGGVKDLRSDISTLRALSPYVRFNTSYSNEDNFRERFPATQGIMEDWDAYKARITEGMGEWWSEIKSYIESRDAKTNDKRLGTSIGESCCIHRNLLFSELSPVTSTTTHRWSIKAIHQILFDTEDEDFDQAQIKPFVYKVTEIVTEPSDVSA